MFSRNGTTEFNDFFHYLVDGFFGFATVFGIVPIIHNMNVEIAISRMTKGGGGQSDALPQCLRILNQGNITFKWHNNVFIEFGIAERIHGLRAGASDVPESFCFGFIISLTMRHGVTVNPCPNLLCILRQCGRVTIDFDEQDSVSGLHSF